jgi:hypothetical protein
MGNDDVRLIGALSEKVGMLLSIAVFFCLWRLARWHWYWAAFAGYFAPALSGFVVGGLLRLLWRDANDGEGIH